MDSGFDIPRNSEKKVSREQLSKWIERGSTSAVLAYGSHAGALDSIVRTNSIPSYNAPVYYEKAGVTNPFVYLFHPLPSQLLKTNPALYEAMQEKWYEDNDKLFENEVTDGNMVKDVKRYAKKSAVEDYIWRKISLGMSYENVESIVDLLKVNEDPEAFVKADGGPVLDIANGVTGVLQSYVQTREELQKLRRIRTPEQIQVLHEAMKFKGVTLYFNEDIFSKGKARPGVEEPDEVVIDSEEKLEALDVISGIEFNSEEDKAYFEELAAIM